MRRPSLRHARGQPLSVRVPARRVLAATSALVSVLVTAGVGSAQHADEQRASTPILVSRVGSLPAPGRPLPLAAFGLGSGGVVTGTEASATRVVGSSMRTPGGVQIEANQAGVLLRFRPGDDGRSRDVLIAPDGFVHLRDGGVGAPDRGGRVSLLLADGTRVTVQCREHGGTGPSAVLVDVVDLAEPVTLWTDPFLRGASKRNIVDASFADLPAGTLWYALGDGRAIYRPTTYGPLVVLDRVVAPAEPDPREPRPAERAVVVSGDVLHASLRRLPMMVTRERVQFPRARDVALTLAREADRIVPLGVAMRPPQGLGEMLVPLGSGFALSVEVLDPAKVHGSIRLGLTRPQAARPVVEWTIRGGRTEAHLVRPSDRDEGRTNGPRYVLRGQRLDDLCGGVFPCGPTDADRLVSGRQLLRRLGARDPEAERATGR
jgi:hypothetical protein